MLTKIFMMPQPMPNCSPDFQRAPKVDEFRVTQRYPNGCFSYDIKERRPLAAKIHGDWYWIIKGKPETHVEFLFRESGRRL